MQDDSLFANTVSTGSVRALLNAASDLSVPVNDLLQATGIGSLLAQHETRIPERHAHWLWERVAMRSGDPFFGLRAAQMAKRGTFSAMEYSLRNTGSMAAALGHLEKYARLLNDGLVARLAVVPEGAQFSFRILGLPLGFPRHLAEFTVALMVRVARELTESHIEPLRICFQHAAPYSTLELTRFFCCPIEFGSAETVLVFPASSLDRLVIQADHALGITLREYTDELLAKLPTNSDMPTRLRYHVAEGLYRGEHRMTEIARTLGMSARTLQRKLQELGTTFESVLESVRHRFAVRYLADTSMPIVELSAKLGYADPGNFYRAFRRWTGLTPQEFRERCGGSDESNLPEVKNAIA